METLKGFAQDERGAVTVDFVVLTASLVGLGIATAAVVSTGVEDLANDLAGGLQQDGLTLASRFDLNRVSNASFENIEGLIEAGWGLYSSNGTIMDWTNGGTVGAELSPSGQYGVTAADGNWMLDLDGSPGNIMLGQQVRGAIAGQTYTATFSAADAIGNNGIEVIWGGEVIQTISPGSATMTQYSVDLIGGAGNGDNMFYLRGIGPEDNVGAFVDAIEITS